MVTANVRNSSCRLVVLITSRTSAGFAGVRTARLHEPLLASRQRRQEGLCVKMVVFGMRITTHLEPAADDNVCACKAFGRLRLPELLTSYVSRMPHAG
eukprot:354674-Chlamydomonas_euryale.AAC.3